jgi:uracil phosphoribosyltransferase
MAEIHPQQAEVELPDVASETRAVVIDLMRAGILPAQSVYETLHGILSPENIRQDHLLLNRVSRPEGGVAGTHISGHKIGGPIEGAYVFVPDPMGATGGTLESTIELYQAEARGNAARWIALHFIVTPEYLRRVTQLKTPVDIFCLRVDRGLSSAEVMKTPLGQNWQAEKGLNQNDYIVPGAGGIGEILNNSFV